MRKKPKIKSLFHHTFLPFIACFLFHFNSYSVAMQDLNENYFDVLYNNFSGLPTSEANDIIQTSDGYIWIASYSSLIRYDGKDFLSYADTQGLSSVLCLFVDSKDRLWIGTNNDGVVLYENNQFSFITEHQDLPSFSTRSITENAEGDILVGTALGMYKVDADLNFHVIDDPRLSNSFVSELESYGDNKTFGITKTGDLFVLNGTEVEEFIAVEEWIYDIPLSVLPLTDQLGEYFLIGTTSNYMVKLRKLDQTSERFTYQKILTGSLKYINHLMEDNQGRIWLGCDYGVGYIDKTGAIIDLDYLSLSKSVEKIMEDAEGNFWLASSKEGVLKLNFSIFKNLTSAIPNMTQVNGVEILDGLIYVASTNGIDIIRASTLQSVSNQLTTLYRDGYFRCVQKDLEGNLWFSSYTDDGLIKYTPKTGEIKTFNHEDGINYSRIRSTMTASDGRIWVATGNGVYVIEQDEVTHYFGIHEGLQNLEILTISEDLNGRIFVGTDGSGVYIIENDEIIHKLSRPEGLLSDIVLRTETDPFNGGTWIVTGNSIAFYDYETDYLQIIEKFPYGNNFDLMFHEDTMVILCSNGIYFVEHDSMLSTDNELSYLHKNHLNGLYSSAVANSFSKIEDGVLYLCGYQNLTAFDLSTTTSSNDYVPPVDLPRILVNEDVVYPSKENYYHLTSTANFLQFDILIPTYALQDYAVSYSLIGYDKLTHHSTYANFIDPTYTNLPGGDYQFYIELTDNRTGAIINSAEFTIIKDYSITEHPIVRAFAVSITILVVLQLIYMIMKRKEQKNLKQQEELTNLFHDTVEVLAKVIDAKDRYTNGHSKRVACYTKEIAKAMGFSPIDTESAYNVALLHDVGKITIPDEVLNKPGRLNKEEFEIMKSHASGGAQILEGIRTWPDLVVGAKYHHERYDGGGYGCGLKGEEIPQIARMICVADAFDAMYSSRVYRKKMDLNFVITELENNAGTQFDPKIVPIFVNLIRSGDMNQMLETFTREDNIHS